MNKNIQNLYVRIMKIHIYKIYKIQIHITAPVFNISAVIR